MESSCRQYHQLHSHLQQTHLRPDLSEPYNITVIQVHAPTSDHKQVHEQLDSIIAKTPKKDILVVQGNWNAKVDSDTYQQQAGTEGKFGIGETNDRGLRLQEFVKSHRLAFFNTLHPHKCL